MTRLDFFVVLAFASQVILAVPKRPYSSQGYYYEGDSDYFGIEKDPLGQPWSNSWKKSPEPLKVAGPFDNHEGFGGGPDKYGSRDEDFGNSRSRPGGSYGGGPWWRPPVQTTQKVPTVPFLAMCVKGCPVSNEYNPVCGSNGVTYQNPGRMECVRNCGIVVQLKYPGPCSSSPGPVEPEPSIDETMTGCVCVVSDDYNPVCGSDHVTYSNPGRLECAQRCGVSVTFVSMGACSNTDPVEASTTENILLTNIIANCMKSCSVTSEFNPVCGTNNVTYANPGRLECAQNCGVQVQLSRKTACGAPLTEEEERNDKVTTVTVTNFITTTTTPYVNSNEDKDTTPVKNEIGNNSEENSNGEVTEIKTRPNEGNSCNDGIRKTPSVAEVMECMQTCTLTSESNPVCGSDSITYMNPGRLLCAQFCGVDVRLKKFAPCNSTSITNVHCLTPCTNPPVSDETDPGSTVESCMKSCPAATDFKPVCGSNNVTYRNLERLQCARRCGVDVNFKRQGLCSAPEAKPNPTSVVKDCIQQCYIPHKYEPICGSDNVTYNNTGHLICTRQCGSDVEVKHFSACQDDTTNGSTTSTTEAPSVTTSTDGHNFTIDPIILASIWNELATTTTAVSPSNDDDEDFELDQRIKDSTAKEIDT